LEACSAMLEAAAVEGSRDSHTGLGCEQGEAAAAAAAGVAAAGEGSAVLVPLRARGRHCQTC
jgi:hypothetical protein